MPDRQRFRLPFLIPCQPVISWQPLIMGGHPHYERRPEALGADADIGSAEAARMMNLILSAANHTVVWHADRRTTQAGVPQGNAAVGETGMEFALLKASSEYSCCECKLTFPRV
jgi:hypothetical protein